MLLRIFRPLYGLSGVGDVYWDQIWELRTSTIFFLNTTADFCLMHAQPDHPELRGVYIADNVFPARRAC